MAQAEFTTPRPLRLGVIVLIALIHVAAIFGLIRAFAPGVVDQVVENVTSAIFVTVKTTPAAPPPAPDDREQGAEGVAGQKAKPREETAPEARIVVAEKPAPRASSTGSENRSGASAGEGTGAGGAAAGRGRAEAAPPSPRRSRGTSIPRATIQRPAAMPASAAASRLP
jgi:protein TonB